jgi:hypothetical protein
VSDEVIGAEPIRVAALARAEVRAAIAPLLAEPHVASGQVSQQLAGHVVEVIEDQGDWLLVRGCDGYEGWMHNGYLSRGSPNGNGLRRVSLGCVVHGAAGTPRALPLRAYVTADERVVDGTVVDEPAVRERFPTEPQAISATAVEYFIGTSYQWGGVTPWGADCSGLVQSVFALHGVQLPRDAWQQARAGQEAGTDLLNLQVADLLFFSDRADGHVTHVAISLGDRRIVHLALGRGGYAVEQLDDATDPYIRKLRARFLFARRILCATSGVCRRC